MGDNPVDTILDISKHFFNPSPNRPEVIISKIDRDRIKDNDYFVIKNIGDKTALNIELSMMILHDALGIGTVHYEFEKVDNLDPLQEKPMDCKVYVIEDDGRKIESSSAKTLLFPQFIKPYTKADYDLLLEYEDTSKRKYRTKFSIGKSGIITKGVSLVKRSISDKVTLAILSIILLVGISVAVRHFMIQPKNNLIAPAPVEVVIKDKNDIEREKLTSKIDHAVNSGDASELNSVMQEVNRKSK